ncbi:MAG: S49 family peptidase [Kiritimatiellia bacterium]
MADGAALSPAQIQELRGVLKKVKSAGKPVWIYADTLGLGSLWLASEASVLALMPQGDINLQGIHVEQMYFKGLMDKVGVQADVIHIGDFKSAGEPFTRTEPSPESAKQTNELLDDLHHLLVRDIAASRGRTAEAIQALIDRGAIPPAAALSEKLVDRLQYRNEFTREVRKQFGTDIDYEYGLDDSREKGFAAVLSLLGGAKPAASTKTAVAVITFEGSITDESILSARREILRAARDRSVRALVFRVNSGGGSALASDVLYEATRVFKKYKKPLVVSMGEVAASGGYYISALADRIYASEATITGSIGVVGGKLVTKGLMDWAGISVTTFQRGKHAGLFSSLHPFSPEEAALVRAESERVYGVFKDAILAGRRDRLKKDLDAIAGGRVYSGLDAKELGLVDEFGGFQEAIESAAEKAGLPKGYEVRLLPKGRELGDLITEMIEGPKPDEDFVAAPAHGISGLFAEVAGDARIKLLETVDPLRAAALRRFLADLQTLQSERVLLSAPFWIPRFN